MKKYIVILVLGFLVGFTGKSDARSGYGYRGGFHRGYGYRGGCYHGGYYGPRACIAYRPYCGPRFWIPGFWGWDNWHRWVWFPGYWR